MSRGAPAPRAAALGALLLLAAGCKHEPRGGLVQGLLDIAGQAASLAGVELEPRARTAERLDALVARARPRLRPGEDA